MTDNSVTVSDRMRELVKQFSDASFACGTHRDDNARSYDEVYEHAENVEWSLLREIGWLETVIDQRGKRIQELEEELGRMADTLVRMITRPKAAPADETRELPCAKCGGQAACWCDRPQTRGAAIPERRTMLDEAIAGVRAQLNAHTTLSHTDVALLFDDRSRLLTALEEEKASNKCLMDALADSLAAELARRDEILALQSASVLQKEELEQKDAELLAIVHDSEDCHCLISVAEIETVKRDCLLVRNEDQNGWIEYCSVPRCLNEPQSPAGA